MKPQQGFTLLEIIVAISIFAIISVMAYGGLDQVLRARDATNQTMDRLAELQMTWSLLGRDLQQVAARNVRDGFGDPLPAFTAGGDNLIELTRAGWPNPLQRPRGHLQRVGWVLDGQILQRLSWNVLDRAQDSEPRVADILTGVTGVELRFLDQQGEWGSQWPPEGGFGQPDQTGRTGQAGNILLPRGIEVILELEDMGDIGRLFQLSEWQPPPARRPAGGQPQPGDGEQDGDADQQNQGADGQQGDNSGQPGLNNGRRTRQQ